MRFVGFGNLDGPVWFVGGEERGQRQEETRRRLEFKRVEDLKRAHLLLGITVHHQPPVTLEPTWRTMCQIMLRLHGLRPTQEDLRVYQAANLGRPESETLLAELLPLPARNGHEWEYGSLFQSRAEYKRAVCPGRIKLLRGLIRKHRPRLVICYGQRDWKYFEELLPRAEWDEEGLFRVGRRGETTAYLTPHFAAHSMDEKRIAQLCRLVRRELGRLPFVEEARKTG